MLKKAANLFTTAYLLIIFCIYPFYMQDGYRDIGEAKYRFFLYVSMAALGIMGICGILYLVREFQRKGSERRAYLIDWDRVSLTDLFVMMYATTVFLSYVLTDYRKEALWGTEGWYIGFIPLILLCILYFFISRMWDGDMRLLYALAAASAGVFLLGICNRFSFYPIPIEEAPSEFISTLGNINWYCGYLSVAAPAGIGMLFLKNQKRWIWAIYAAITFMAAFSQGGDSIFLWFAALLFLLLWISLEKREQLKNWLLIVMVWGVSAQLIRLMRYLLPGKYNYDVDNLCGYFTGSSLTLWISAAAAFLYIVISIKQQDLLKKKISDIRKALFAAGFLLIGGWLILSVINTKWGIPVLKGRSFFVLNADWGNGRGAAFWAGISIFRELPLLHKLFGAGPDCFSVSAYSMPELTGMLRENFGSNRLTNAHNELLTGLVNTGILGVSFYIGIFGSFIADCMRKGKENPELYVFALCAGCYLLHNTISFAQVLNLPFVFLIIGMGVKKSH